MKTAIEQQLEEQQQVFAALRRECPAMIERIVRELTACYRRGGKILIFGSGGSAADAQHIAAELVGRFAKERRALPAVALTANTSTLTALANDYAYETVFSRQVEALGLPGDVAVGISTSGTAKNVLAALRGARQRDLLCIGLTGAGGDALAAACDVCLIVPSHNTPRIQEAHIAAAHIVCQLVEQSLFPA
ncbi:MAG: D-sedoheptulose 7-phosphate isomerase [Candidatus Omnitrophica bacterium]|nr:D-sedoheptulose 7-phosphate isomerase [Candidatus Omnitrophota bacterium]